LCIVITGCGPHDNDIPEDANAIFHDFVTELRAAGHTITAAQITCGGAETAELPPVNYHVTYLAGSGEWTVKAEGQEDNPYLRRDTQQEAINAAISLVGCRGRVIVHQMDGTISEKSQ
jgi:hypothetical protein